jgi:phosphatidylglycerol:prolipoprotein diacylglycerol transferase
MHPILFRIPLPHRPLMLWWALAAVAAIAVVYALASMRKNDRNTAGVSLVVAIAAGAGAYVFRETKFEAHALPIYSYGVMLGLSLLVGWYVTLTLAERDGLPRETMANCYVVTALAAIVGSRLLYVATNSSEFNQFSDLFALRRGGLVAYGGFLGGYVGSWAYLSRNRIRLLPWADVAVPSLASGLMITRVGCYLFGCDFGKRLPETAPALLKKMGTFPHWTGGMAEGGEGAPAYVRHLEIFRGTPLGSEIMKSNASLAVHPTQIYESICGLALLVFLLWQRKNQKFRGQIFFSFVFGYGVLRFILEILRDDTERGEYGPVMSEHVLVPGALLLMAIAFIFGMALGIRNEKLRTVARVLALVPPVAAYILLKPQTFAASVATQLSTSQWIAFLTALLVAYFYAKLWDQARKSPKLAMGPGSLGEIFEEEEKAKEKAAKKAKKAGKAAEVTAKELEDVKNEQAAEAKAEADARAKAAADDDKSGDKADNKAGADDEDGSDDDDESDDDDGDDVGDGDDKPSQDDKSSKENKK